MTIEEFFIFVHAQSILSGIIAVLAFVLYRRRSTEVKIIGLIFLVSFLLSTSVYYLPLKGKEVNIAGNLYTICYTAILFFLFDISLKKGYNRLFKLLLIVFSLASIGNFIFIQKLDINTYTNILSALTLIPCCIIYYYRLLIDLPTLKIHRLPMFWFAAGFMIYNAGTLFLYVFTEYLVNVLHNNLLIYWSIHNVFILSYICSSWLDFATT
jgi:hypothetical protein